MDDVEIRPARLTDVSGTRRVARRGWTDAYGDFLSKSVIEAELSTWYAADAVEAAVSHPDRPYFVATDEETVIGYTKARANAPVADLSTLYVSPDRWGAGIGTRLLDAATDEFQSHGAEALRLTVFAENDAAMAFYESKGFERVDEHISELEAGSAPEYVYRKEL